MAPSQLDIENLKVLVDMDVRGGDKRLNEMLTKCVVIVVRVLSDLGLNEVDAAVIDGLPAPSSAAQFRGRRLTNFNMIMAMHTAKFRINKGRWPDE